MVKRPHPPHPTPQRKLAVALRTAAALAIVFAIPSLPAQAPQPKLSTHARSADEIAGLLDRTRTLCDYGHAAAPYTLTATMEVFDGFEARLATATLEQTWLAPGRYQRDVLFDGHRYSSFGTPQGTESRKTPHRPRHPPRVRRSTPRPIRRPGPRPGSLPPAAGGPDPRRPRSPSSTSTAPPAQVTTISPPSASPRTACFAPSSRPTEKQPSTRASTPPAHKPFPSAWTSTATSAWSARVEVQRIDPLPTTSIVTPPPGLQPSPTLVDEAEASEAATRHFLPQVAGTSSGFSAGATVILGVRIGTDGHVEDCTVLSPIPSYAATLASNFVMDWRFKPFLVEGKPVEASTMLTLQFRTPVAAPPTRSSRRLRFQAETPRLRCSLPQEHRTSSTGTSVMPYAVIE